MTVSLTQRSATVARIDDYPRAIRGLPPCRTLCVVEQLFVRRPESAERVAHRRTGTVQEVRLLIHQRRELTKGRRCRAKRDRLRA